jgi:type II secretory pathway pseudopilin PulG
MKLTTVRNKGTVGALRRTWQSAFTLAECLAAMAFMAIVIPVAVQALHVASLAGQVAARKGEAARVAGRVLNQSIVMTNWSNGSQSGTIDEGQDEFRWKMDSQAWPKGSMELLTADVSFTAQGHDYTVSMSTLANLQSQTNAPGGGL